MHRAEQIIDALVTLLATSQASVFKHRVLRLSDQDQELPAISVRLGDDEPLDEDGASNLAFLDSLLTVEIDLLIEGPEVETVITNLMALRTSIHIAIMADRSLGLVWVIDTRYGGADEPETEQREQLAGVITTRWHVHYRMNIGDPS